MNEAIVINLSATLDENKYKVVYLACTLYDKFPAKNLYGSEALFLFHHSRDYQMPKTAIVINGLINYFGHFRGLDFFHDYTIPDNELILANDDHSQTVKIVIDDNT